MTNRVIQLLVLAAAHQRQGRMQRASQLFVEASTSPEFPKAVRSFQAQVARANLQKASAPRVVASASWPFNTVRSAKVKAEAEGNDDAADDDVVEAGLEEDFVDMGLGDDATLDDAVLELSAAEEDEEDEPEEVDAAADDGDADEDDGEAEEAPAAEKSAVTAALFARQCRNMLAVQAAAKAKKAVKKPVKKPAGKKPAGKK